MHEPQWIEKQLKEAGGNRHITNRGSEIPVEALEYEPQSISEYEQEHGVPYIVDKLQIKSDFALDNKIKIKTRGIEEFILSQTERDSSVSYENILERMLAKLPEPLERMIQSKRNLQVLDSLFQEVAILQNLSGKTYLKVLEDRINQQRVEMLKQQLIQNLQTIMSK